MFRSEDFSQAGFLSILFAQAQEPLAFWDKKVRGLNQSIFIKLAMINFPIHPDRKQWKDQKNHRRK